MKPLHKKMIRLAIQHPRIRQTLLRLAYRQKIGTGYRSWLDISGGEPTIYSHFKEFITHETTLEKNVSFLVDQAVDTVTISIDSPEKHHDTIRGMEGSRALVAKNFPPDCVRCCQHRYTENVKLGHDNQDSPHS
jgi:hypothetical protein